MRRKTETGLNRHGLVFDKLTNGASSNAMSKHRLTASLTT